MKTNPNAPMIPVYGNEGTLQTESDMVYLEGMGALTGITLRQHYAGLNMAAGIMAVGNKKLETGYIKQIAKEAVECADALIYELNKS